LEAAVRENLWQNSGREQKAQRENGIALLHSPLEGEGRARRARDLVAKVKAIAGE